MPRILIQTVDGREHAFDTSAEQAEQVRAAFQRATETDMSGAFLLGASVVIAWRNTAAVKVLASKPPQPRISPERA